MSCIFFCFLVVFFNWIKLNLLILPTNTRYQITSMLVNYYMCLNIFVALTYVIRTFTTSKTKTLCDSSQQLIRLVYGNKVLIKMLWNAIKQCLVWSRLVGKGLAEDHIGLVIIFPKNGTKKPSVEFRLYFLFKTSGADLLNFLASFSNTSNLFLTVLLNKDIASKSFSDFVKELFQRSGPLIDILSLLFPLMNN